LADRKLLLLLDNFEQLIDASPFVSQLATVCPNLAILITSRVRLRLSNEREYVLAPLSVANAGDPLDRLKSNEANLLFAERAKRVDQQFALSGENAVAVTEICCRLDGLPLAIELAASRLRILPVPVLLERLDRPLPLLTGGDRDRPPRQQSMRETIAWSYDLLRPAEQRVLRWMSVFIGGISLESADALGHALDLAPIESLGTVTTLVEYGLLRQIRSPSGTPRFAMLETIREFGLEQLTEAGELEGARRAHAEHFLAFASRDAPAPYEPVSDAWVGRLAAEHPNLLVAFHYLSIPETAEESLQFAAAMGPYWSSRGPFSEWQPGLSRVIDLVTPEPRIVKAHVLYWLTMILAASPDFPAALQAANRCVEMAVQVGAPNDQAAALHIRAFVHECHQHWEFAREQCDQAIELSITVGNTYMQAMCLKMKATSACALGEIDDAQRDAEQAASLFRALDAMDQFALIGCVLAMIAVARGELARAATYCEESLRIWLSTETLTRWFRPLVGLAYVAAAIGQFANAARLLGAADAMLIAGGRDLSQFDRPPYERAETQCRETLGNADFEEHRLAGSLLPPDAWLVEADEIVEAARVHSAPMT
jgi:non-specific serine/threonine protein kinase